MSDEMFMADMVAEISTIVTHPAGVVLDASGDPVLDAQGEPVYKEQS